MDIVITYVNGLDLEWQKDYERCVGTKALTKRFRDWGTLPFLFRGIEECMPFINNVFLVVARESQVPTWINRDTVKVVFHRDFIPAEFLPTFNSTAIEMFMHRIEGLGEEFIYFNDDCFPVQSCEANDFFRGGLAAASLSRHILTFGHLFRIHTKRSDRLARQASGTKSCGVYLRPQHTCTPMLRSVCGELYDRCEADIRASVTPLRHKRNYNQYVFTDYAFFTGRTFRRRISNRHFSLSIASIKKIERAILQPNRAILCINDVEMSDEKFINYQQHILQAFETRFPRASKFELWT